MPTAAMVNARRLLLVVVVTLHPGRMNNQNMFFHRPMGIILEPLHVKKMGTVSAPSRRQKKAVTYSGFSQKIARLGSIIFQLLPQVAHVNTQIMAIFRMRRPPDFTQ